MHHRGSPSQQRVANTLFYSFPFPTKVAEYLTNTQECFRPSEVPAICEIKPDERNSQSTKYYLQISNELFYLI